MGHYVENRLLQNPSQPPFAKGRSPARGGIKPPPFKKGGTGGFSWFVPARRSAYAGLALVSRFGTQTWVPSGHGALVANGLIEAYRPLKSSPWDFYKKRIYRRKEKR